MTPTNAERLSAALQRLFDPDPPPADADEGLAHLEHAVREVAADDLVTVMAADQTFRTEKRGIDGLVDAWRDWLAPYDSYRIELEELIDAGDHVVTFVRQYGVPHGGGVEIESASAAVWSFRDGRVARVEFHLDREAALRAAGLEPKTGRPAQSSQA